MNIIINSIEKCNLYPCLNDCIFLFVQFGMGQDMMEQDFDNSEPFIGNDIMISSILIDMANKIDLSAFDKTFRAIFRAILIKIWRPS